MKILLSWSSGKDSAWALHVLEQQHPGAVAALLTTLNESVDRVVMHGVRRDVLEAQAMAAGLPLWKVPLPHPCSNEAYEARMRDAVARAVAEGFTHVAFGDLFLEDVRRYREERLAESGLAPRAHRLRRHASPARGVRRPGIRSRAAARAAGRRRPLRREGGVPHLRLCGPDVCVAVGPRTGRNRNARALRLA
jgi:hypothetical protein